MEVLITEVTEMGAGNYCVAGWDIREMRMVRPLPGGGNWPAALLGRHAVAVGKLVRVTPRGQSTGIFPHRTEDTAIDAASIMTSSRTFSDWMGASAPATTTDLTDGFDGYLRWNREWNGAKQGVHVTPDTRCPSLIAVRAHRSNLSFIEAFGKLRAILKDATDCYQLTVSSKALKEAWRGGGLRGANEALPARQHFHVRVGLARPFGDPPKCFAMLNGVL